MLGALAFPWWVHASVVGLSAVGAKPIGNPGAALCILLTGAALAVFIARRSLAGSIITHEAPRDPLALRIGAAALTLAAAIAFAGALLASIAFPIVAYDALAYRLPTIASWLDVGRVAWVVTDDAVRNGYPLGQEAVSAVIAAATGSLRFSAVPSFLFVLEGALALVVCAEDAGVRPRVARACAALFVLTPIVLLNAPSGYVDAAFGGAVVALVCLAATLSGARSNEGLLAAATGMAAANVLSLKGNGIAFVAIAVLAIAARAVSGRPRARDVAIALACALPGAFWVLRNAVHTGNPLFPVEVRVFGHVFRGIGSMAAVLDETHNTPAVFGNLGLAGRLLRTWSEWHGPATDFDDRFAGLGYSWALVAVPALLAFAWHAVRAPRDARVQRVGFAVLLVAAFFALQPMKWWPRYTVWLWAAGALAIAFEAESLLQENRNKMFAAVASLVTFFAVGEGAYALGHANGVAIALGRRAGEAVLHDPLAGVNASSGIDPSFGSLGLTGDREICRGAWKPGTDNANLDGVFAQLRPRPQVHVFMDDERSWREVHSGFLNADCPALLLFRNSPLVRAALEDPSVSVQPAVAFDPLFVVRPRKGAPAARVSEKDP